MLKRWSVGASLFAALLVATNLTAGEKTAPHIVARVNSLDGAFDNVKLMLQLVGQENLAEHIEGLVKSKVGVNGLEGIDPKRPFGAYARITADTNQSHGVAMIPIADKEAFLRLLANLNYQARKGENGIYTVNVGLPADIHLRFANGYAYITLLQLRALEKANLPSPQSVFPKKDSSTLSLTVHLSRIPKAAKFIPSQLLENAVAQAQEKEMPGLTQAQETFRQRVLASAAKQIDRAIQEGGEFSLALNIDSQSKKLIADVTLSAASGTKLQSDLADLAKRPSAVGAVAQGKAAVRLHGRVSLPGGAMASYQAVIDELLAKALAEVKDAQKRAQAKRLLDVLAPTLKTGEFEGALMIDGPSQNDQFTVLAAAHLKNGSKVESTLRELLNDALKTASAEERKRIQLDAEKVGGVGIHRIAVPIPDPNVQQFLGNHPIYVAFRDDALFVAFGENGLAAIKKAAASKPGPTASLLTMEIDLAKIGPLLAKSPEQRTALRKIFADGDSGRVQVSLTAGASLRLRFAADLSVVRLVSQLAQQKGNELR